jgi:uncharacterized GH25 family protein
MRARGDKRREAREVASAVQAPVASPAQLVERVELQQLVASQVLALAEPYRSTVLLHYFEDLSCADIARRFELPEGTVRRRLKVARDELRDRIDARERNRGGVAVLAPLCGLATPASPAASLAVGVVAMKKVIAVVAIVLALVLAVAVWKTRGSSAPASAQQPSGQPGALVANDLNAVSAESANIPVWLAQPDVKPRRIAGKVTFRGQPVAGATVELASLASESGLVAAPRRTTTRSGDFDFGTQPVLSWSVRATAPGKSATSVDVDLRDPSARPAPDRLELELGACSSAMFGTIRDASGGPIASAQIARLPDVSPPFLLKPASVPGGPAVTSDDKGAYELCAETRSPGFVGVVVSADGYASITARTLVPGRLHIDFALVPEATIVGHVIRDDTSAPIARAYVFVPQGPPGPESTPVRGTFTDANGQFRLDGIAAGRRVVFARADGMMESAQGTPVVVGVGQTSVDVEIRLETGSTVRGKVMASNQPIAGAHVTAVDALRGNSATTAVSQDDGSFVLTGVPRAEIRFTAAPYDVVKPTLLRISQPMHDGVTLEVEPLGTIIGHVIRNHKPVSGASISFRGPNQRDLPMVATDASGRFEIHGLRPGPWTISGEDTHAGTFGDSEEPIQLARGETKEITIDLNCGASIAGRVVDQNGSAVAGVSVQFRHTKANDEGQAATAEDGSFRAAMMEGGGDYRAMVLRNPMSGPELPPANGTPFPLISVADCNAAVTGVVLGVRVDQLAIAGKVVDSTGAPVADARVFADVIDATGKPRWRGPAGGFQGPADTTDVDGHFSIPNLSTGAYALRARSPAGVETIVLGVNAGRSDVTLVLPAPGAIDVTVAGFSSSPEVAAVPNSPNTAPVLAKQQGFAYVLANLSPGSYVVTARTTSEAASAVVTVAAGLTVRTELTSAGSGVVAGHVRDFRSGKPVEGAMCRAMPRLAWKPDTAQDEGVRSDAQGAFLINGAPTGDIAISCDGPGAYTEGLRLVTLQASQRIDIEVPLVPRWIGPAGSIGARPDTSALVGRLVSVQPGGPAAVAGFVDGDVIVSVDGASVTELSPEGVWVFVVNRAPGTKIKITVTRAGKTISGEVTLAALSGSW